MVASDWVGKTGACTHIASYLCRYAGDRHSQNQKHRLPSHPCRENVMSSVRSGNRAIQKYGTRCRRTAAAFGPDAFERTSHRPRGYHPISPLSRQAARIDTILVLEGDVETAAHLFRVPDSQLVERVLEHLKKKTGGPRISHKRNDALGGGKTGDEGVVLLVGSSFRARLGRDCCPRALRGRGLTGIKVRVHGRDQGGGKLLTPSPGTKRHTFSRYEE